MRHLLAVAFLGVACLGSMNGTFSCTNGFGGQFAAYEIEGSISAFTARAQFQSGACSWIGRIGGLRRGQ